MCIRDSFAEEGWTEGGAVREVARTYLDDLLHHEIDTLVLGCTHYPFAVEALRAKVGPDVRLIDTGEPVARHTHQLLQARAIPLQVADPSAGPDHPSGHLTLVSTGPPDSLRAAALTLPIWPFLFARQQMYAARFLTRLIDELRRAVHVVAIGSVTLVVVGWLLDATVSRTWIAVFLPVALAGVAAERFLVRRWFVRRRRAGHSLRDVVIVGASDEALEIETLEDPEEPLVFAVPAPHSGSDALTEITISGKGIRRLELR